MTAKQLVAEAIELGAVCDDSPSFESVDAAMPWLDSHACCHLSEADSCHPDGPLRQYALDHLVLKPPDNLELPDRITIPRVLEREVLERHEP